MRVPSFVFGVRAASQDGIERFFPHELQRKLLPTTAINHVTHMTEGIAETTLQVGTAFGQEITQVRPRNAVLAVLSVWGDFTAHAVVVVWDLWCGVVWDLWCAGHHFTSALWGQSRAARRGDPRSHDPRRQDKHCGEG